jgi:hypothetical protein
MIIGISQSVQRAMQGSFPYRYSVVVAISSSLHAVKMPVTVVFSLDIIILSLFQKKIILSYNVFYQYVRHYAA